MKTIAIFIIVFLLTSSCKQKKESVKASVEEIEQEALTENIVPTSIKNLAKFGISTYSDSMDINQVFQFKEVDKNGMVKTVNINRVSNLYDQMTKNTEMKSWPIVEINKSDEVILAVDGKGFGGAIWAKVLVDKNTLKIKKIEFDHIAESEGYGAAFTKTNFENQFAGAKIDFEKNAFILSKSIEKRKDDGVVIDGISGATMTSRGAVDMVNYGLRRYKAYFEK